MKPVAPVPKPFAPPTGGRRPDTLIAIAVLAALLALAPFGVYPYFLAQVLCMALFACAFNLLVGYSGLLSFGHALFFGAASYFAAHAAKVYGWPPEGAILAATLAAAALGLVAGACRSAARASISR